MLDGEQKIIQAAVSVQASAFGDLYDFYHSQIYRFVFLKVGRREEAEDLTHQVFMNAWTNIKKYKHQGHPFSSWLYRIARNQVIDHYRTRRGEYSLEGMESDYFVAPIAAHFDLGNKMEMERVMRAMKELKPEYQDVIIMRFIEDLSVKEVASTVGKSEGAVKLLQHKAIKELKISLDVHEA